MTTLSWPPAFTIRISRRCSRISLRISTKGLEVVTPKKMSQQKVVDFLKLKRAWIQKHWHLTAPKEEILLPTVLNLEAIGEIWQVKYHHSRQKLKCDDLTKELTLCVQDQIETIGHIKHWLKIKATNFLKQTLAESSSKYSLPYGEVRIKFQKSRWGSCSKTKNINLNCKLLLLPFDVVHYVIVHELVHTVHFDHSKLFWSAVKKIIPNYKEIRINLKKLESQLPNWLY